MLLLLSAFSAAGGVLAWRQHRELIELRAAAMNRTERADWQRRVWELEKSNRELRNERASAEGEGEAGRSPGALAAGGRSGRPRAGSGERGGGSLQRQANAFRELMGKPEIQALVSFQQKVGIEARYSALFRNLNLSPEQAEKLKSLLAERAPTMQDVMSIARDQGIDPRGNPDAFRQLVADSQREIDNSIKSVIGEPGYAELSRYEQTIPQRNLVEELQQRLAYSSTPLSSAQAEQMVQILASTAPARPGDPATAGSMDPPTGAPLPSGPGRGFGAGGGDFSGVLNALGGGAGLGMLIGGIETGTRSGGSTVVTPASVDQAQAVLAPAQVAVLQQIQQQQQNQQQLRRLMSDALTSGTPQPASPGAGLNSSNSSPSPAGDGTTRNKRGGGD